MTAPDLPTEEPAAKRPEVLYDSQLQRFIYWADCELRALGIWLGFPS